MTYIAENDHTKHGDTKRKFFSKKIHMKDKQKIRRSLHFMVPPSSGTQTKNHSPCVDCMMLCNHGNMWCSTLVNMPTAQAIHRCSVGQVWVSLNKDTDQGLKETCTLSPGHSRSRKNQQCENPSINSSNPLRILAFLFPLMALQLTEGFWTRQQVGLGVSHPDIKKRHPAASSRSHKPECQPELL